MLSLLTIAVLKAYASRFAVAKIGVSAKEAYLEFASLQALGNKKLNGAMDAYSSEIQVSMTNLPRINFRPQSNPAASMLIMTKFLKFAVSFT